MKPAWALFASAMILATPAVAVSKPHVVLLGNWKTIKLQADDDSSAQELKVRALLVDGKTKEFTVGPLHDITDHNFTVQRMFRLNDSLPQEAGPTRWRWERGGWLLVDRVSGRAQPIALPEFDPNYSKASWFRDYVAYCGTSDDGQKLFAVIAQAGKRKPLLNKGLPEQTETCAPPVWQRGPVRVTFATKEDPKLTFTVTSRAVDLASEDENEGDD